MKTITLRIDGMRCDGCASTIQALLQRSAGVHGASVSLKEGEARVLYDPAAVTVTELTAVIEKSGYRVRDRSDG